MIKEELVKKHKGMFAEGWPPWFDINNGWVVIVDAALSLIKWDVEKNKMPKVEINQIKEKFGGLNIYYDGGDEKTRGIIDMASSMANKTCEVCGTNEEIGYTTGWVTTICKTCAEKEGKIEKFKLK